ncbi:hypothetical protein B0H34DRAFT_754101 [Crassisporium funariophilum]|nr:hypothetical protein B0H34DRAFT_754101 [Crassisporium funariophilum]
MDKGKRRASPILVDDSSGDGDPSYNAIDVDSDDSSDGSISHRSTADITDLAKVTGKRKASPIVVDGSFEDAGLEDDTFDVDSDHDGSESGIPQKSMTHTRNPSGKNQHGRIPILDETLKEILRGYNRNNITSYAKIIDRLGQDHGHKIGRSTLAKYLTATGIGSSRKKLIPDKEATQLVLDELADDPKQTRGPRNIKERLALKGKHITVKSVASVMHDFADEGFDKRMPTSKAIMRTPLTGIGPDEEWSMDGHDKLRKAGFDIYGIRDKWTGTWHYYRVLPSNRYASVIGVVQLECIKKVGGMAVQGSTDHGSEVRDAFLFFVALREHFEPGLLEALIPSWKFLPSTKNITIERGWRPLFHKWGVNILDFFYAGVNGGVFEAGNDLHKETSNWIWFPLVQRELDKFTDYQNNHRIRPQKAKNLPSGGTPNEFYKNPDRWGGVSCLIPVDGQVLDQLIEGCEEGRRLMRHVDEDFEKIADQAYIAIGEPQITLQSAWEVFQALVEHMTPVE